MVFKRYVEIGRVALVNYGKDHGKLVVIVDVVDQNRALVDAPDMERIQMNFKRLSLTDIVIEINRVPKKKVLIEAMEKADVKNKWEKSSWGRKLIVQKRRLTSMILIGSRSCWPRSRKLLLSDKSLQNSRRRSLPDQIYYLQICFSLDSWASVPGSFVDHEMTHSDHSKAL